MRTIHYPLEIMELRQERVLDAGSRLKGDLLVNQGFDEETAVREAQHCLGNIQCEFCDLCRLFCPDLCITRNESTSQIEIDLNYCKGCGICAAICPRGAIKMVLEE